jgi:hypothetical protein
MPRLDGDSILRAYRLVRAADNHASMRVIGIRLTLELAMRDDVGQQLSNNDERENQGERVNVP